MTSDASAQNSANQPQHFEVSDLTKVFETDEGQITAVENVNFTIEGDTFFTMLGPSGCGKTTTLRMIAGLETVTSGRITSNGSDFRRMDAFERNIGMVFQSYALFPHMTVFENAAYGLRLRKAEQPKVKKSVNRILEMLQLDGLAHRYPADLSGGQQQRVSIARALVYEPGMLLLDEPLANLDAKLRVEMREEIRRLQKSLGIMALYVTHDQEEAMAVSDSLAVFSNGRLMQLGEPYQIYAEPNSLFVADFIGKANFFPVNINQKHAGRVSVSSRAGVAFNDVVLRPGAAGEQDWYTGETVMLMARPEKLWISSVSKQADDATVLKGKVTRIQFLGTFVRYLVETTEALRPVIVDVPEFADGVEEGSEVLFGFNPSKTVAFEKPSQ